MLHVDFALETRWLHKSIRRFRAARLRFGAGNCECFGCLPDGASLASVRLRWLGAIVRAHLKDKAVELGKDKFYSARDIATLLGLEGIKSYDDLYNTLVSMRHCN